MAHTKDKGAAPAAPADLPVSSLREATPFLRRPFTPEAVKFKVQTVFKGASGCLIVGYIDARLVIERLNAVIPDKWEAVFRPLEGTKLMECALTVDGVTRVDAGESPKGLSKDLYSDALKRAAVHFGVGVSIYAVPQIRLMASQPHVEQRQVAGKPSLVLNEHGHTKLREGYAKWLKEVGEPQFGAALDHGDTVGETVDPDVEAEQFVPAPAAPLEDEKAKSLRAAAEAAYEKLSAEPEGKRRIPPGQFQGWLTGAAHSHEELERLIAHLEKTYGEVTA